MLAEEECPDELRADMQQYYGLNIDGMGVDYSYAHAAVLVSQLPSNSRVCKFINPDAEWTEETALLASIDYSLRWLMWSRTKDAQHDRNHPELVKTPSERKAARERGMHVDLDLVRAVLGEGK